MPMDTNYLNATADHGGTLITHLGLVDGGGTELTGGGYARQAVSWVAAAAGLIRPTTDELFSVPAGATVAGWRGFTALTGGTNRGGQALTAETFAGAGTYTLAAASTTITHSAV